MEPLVDFPRRMDTVEARLQATETQILHLRTEMRDEFSATRAAIKGGDDAVRADLREEIRTLGFGLRAEIKDVDEGLHREIVQGDEQTRTMMRVLHTEVRAMHKDLVRRIESLRRRR